MKGQILLWIFLCVWTPVFSDVSCAVKENWEGAVRAKVLRSLDQFLEWTTPKTLKTYAIASIHDLETIVGCDPSIQAFDRCYGYFSPYRPLVGTVTKDVQDLQSVLQLLERVGGLSCTAEFVEFATLELLCKVVSYREMSPGQRLLIPLRQEDKIVLEPFVVDCVFDLWRGMPAFGLRPLGKDVHALLLFRGTDLSLRSMRGFASVMSDLDWQGPGLQVFQKAQPLLHSWLEKQYAEGHPTRVLGFSLGGALAAYTFIYENPLIASSGSYCFNAPGVSMAVIDAWKKLPTARQCGLQMYVVEGDLISKSGKLFGDVFCLSEPIPLLPLAAHTTLMCAAHHFMRVRIDVTQENLSR